MKIPFLRKYMSAAAPPAARLPATPDSEESKLLRHIESLNLEIVIARNKLDWKRVGRLEKQKADAGKKLAETQTLQLL